MTTTTSKTITQYGWSRRNYQGQWDNTYQVPLAETDSSADAHIYKGDDDDDVWHAQMDWCFGYYPDESDTERRYRTSYKSCYIHVKKDFRLLRQAKDWCEKQALGMTMEKRNRAVELKKQQVAELEALRATHAEALTDLVRS